MFFYLFLNTVHENAEEAFKRAKENCPFLLQKINQRGPFYVPGDVGGLGIDGSMFQYQMLKVCELMCIGPSSTVFDLGCGNGFSTFIISLFNPLMIIAMEIKQNL